MQAKGCGCQSAEKRRGGCHETSTPVPVPQCRAEKAWPACTVCIYRAPACTAKEHLRLQLPDNLNPATVKLGLCIWKSTC